MAMAGAFSGVGASGVQCDKMSNARLGAGGRTRRGQDSVSAHFELSFSLFPPPAFQPARPCSLRGGFFFVVRFLPLSFLPCRTSSPRLLHQSPPCVSAEDHTVSHIPAQLMTNLNMEPLNLLPTLPPPTTTSTTTQPCLPRLSHTHTHTHTSIIFASFEDQSAFFYLFPIPLWSLSTSPPGGWISQGSSHVLLTSAAWRLL